MDKKFFDKILDDLIYEAVTECALEEEGNQDETVTFSKEHEEKMQKLFKEVRQKERKQVFVSVTKKVAIIVIVSTAVMLSLTPNISAWKEKIKEFFIKDEDEYSWITFGDPDDVNSFNASVSGENTVISGDNAQIDFLGYIPKGYTVSIRDDNGKAKNVELKNGDNLIAIKISKDTVKALDTENLEYENVVINKKNIYKIAREGRVTYTWQSNEYVFRIHGKETNDNLIKIIENIKYEKIEKIF